MSFKILAWCARKVGSFYLCLDKPFAWWFIHFIESHQPEGLMNLFFYIWENALHHAFMTRFRKLDVQTPILLKLNWSLVFVETYKYGVFPSALDKLWHRIRPHLSFTNIRMGSCLLSQALFQIDRPSILYFFLFLSVDSLTHIVTLPLSAVILGYLLKFFAIPDFNPIFFP